MSDPAPATHPPKKLNQALSSSFHNIDMDDPSHAEPAQIDGSTSSPKEDLAASQVSEEKKRLPAIFRYPLVVAASVPTLGCLSIVGLAASVILLISFLVVRTLQLFRCDRHYAKLARIKHSLRIGLCICALLMFIGMSMFVPIFNYVPFLKQLRFLQLPLTEWIVIIIIMSALCIFSSFLYCIVHLEIPGYLSCFSLNTKLACSEIIDSLFCLWGSYQVAKNAPSVRHHKILGLATQERINVSILVLIGYNLIILLTRLNVHMLHKVCRQNVYSQSSWQCCLRKCNYLRYVVYYAKGMTISITFMLSSLLLLLTWTLYFGLNQHMMSSSSQTWELGLWTLVSLNICSFLWLIKTFVLLSWEAHTIYDRLWDRISSARQKSYFLCILFREKTTPDIDDDVNDHKKAVRDSSERSHLRKFLDFIFEALVDIVDEEQPTTIELQKNWLVRKPDKTFKDINTIQELSQHFIQAKHILTKQTQLSEIRKEFALGSGLSKSLVLSISEDHETTATTEPFIKVAVDEAYKSLISHPKLEERKNHLIKFLSLLHGEKALKHIGHHVPYYTVQKWVERAHSQCVNLANTIYSAKELTNCLNKIISGLLIGVIFIMWLLLTGLASTKVFVLIASPLLAATFIFGDTCKTLFQGIIYVFMVHPFDVGDLCLIEEKMMEVKSIGIWTTTFVKVDKYGTEKELVIYSNSELPSKTVINHKTKFDWSDRAEFNLDTLKMTKESIEAGALTFLKNNLLPYDGDNEGEYFSKEDDDEQNYLKPIEEVGNDIRTYGIDENEWIYVKRKCRILAKSPNLSLSTNEEKLTLVVRLEYHAGNTEDWTYSECLLEKDRLKGCFCLYVHGIISRFCTFKDKRYPT